MAQLEVSRRHTETPTPKTPKAQHSPTFEQLLQGDASARFSTSPTLAINHDPEEDFNHPINKKSVLTRVKEKARKLRHSLSAKKKHDNEILDSKTTPSWDVSLEDYNDEEEDDDPEYLGAPMYESELAPAACKENARQHPRADPVVSENHLWPTRIKHEDEEKDKPVVAHNKSITETVTEKLAPAYAVVSDATHTIACKIAGLTTSSPEGQQKHTTRDTEHYNADDGLKNLCRTSEIREHSSNRSAHKWDKGVSVREYFMNKLEPGEDDRALSQVISEAISPKGAGDNLGVVEKVREAVTSLLRHEESPQSSPKGYVAEPSRLTIKTTNLSSNIPVSTKTGVPSPNSTNMNSSFLGASSMEEPSKQTFKATNLSSVTPVLTKTGVQPTNSISSTNVNTSSHLPISYGASSLEKALKEKIKEMSSNVPISCTTEVPKPNSISSSNVNLSSYVPVSPRCASGMKEPSKVTTKATNLSSNFPISIRTEVPPLNSPSHIPISRSASLPPHVLVSHRANSSPLIPISTNAQEVVEEQSHGRILQAN